MKYYKTNESVAEENIKDMFPPSQAKRFSSDILERLSTNKVTVMAAYLVDKENCGGFGRLYGYAKLDNPFVLECDDFYHKGEKIHVETNYIKFIYTVYRPNRTSEYMSTIQPYYDYPYKDPSGVNPNYHQENEQVRIQLEHSSGWGALGFLENIPIKDLSGDDLDCRLFIENVTKVSLEEDWASLLQGITTEKSQKTVLTI